MMERSNRKLEFIGELRAGLLDRTGIKDQRREMAHSDEPVEICCFVTMIVDLGLVK